MKGKGSKDRNNKEERKKYKASPLWCPKCGFGENSCKCPKKKRGK